MYAPTASNLSETSLNHRQVNEPSSLKPCILTKFFFFATAFLNNILCEICKDYCPNKQGTPSTSYYTPRTFLPFPLSSYYHNSHSAHFPPFSLWLRSIGIYPCSNGLLKHANIHLKKKKTYQKTLSSKQQQQQQQQRQHIQKILRKEK